MWPLSINAAVTAVLSELDGNFTIKEEQRMASNAFLSRENKWHAQPGMARILLNAAAHWSLPRGSDRK